MYIEVLTLRANKQKVFEIRALLTKENNKKNKCRGRKQHPGFEEVLKILRAEKLSTSQRTEDNVLNTRNIVCAGDVGERPKVLSNRNSRSVKREMCKNSSMTPKKAVGVLSKAVNE